MIRKIFLSSLTVAFLFIQFSRADEGMWIPLLLKKMNESKMQELGMKLSAEDIYSINSSSLKDAVVSFGGFCTAEVISSQGLLLTNHHCGYGKIQEHSSVENDYLKNGFWAMSKDKELPNPGLTATFIIRIENVTDRVLKGTDTLNIVVRSAKISENIKELENGAVKGTHYGASIKPFYSGLEYYMFITETFRDIRLVGAPPSAIGKFGGDTDNWMWPRHTGDFSVFRIYAGKDNKPADYSKDNVPYKPRYHFPISLDGYQPGDFTMVYGFPGRTEEYLSSYAVDFLMNSSYPTRIKVREAKLDVINEAMRSSDELRIKYAAKQSRISNAYKKWSGAIRGLKKLNALEKKQTLEANFEQWVNANHPDNEDYKMLLQRFENAYEKYSKQALVQDLYHEAFYGPEIITLANKMINLVNDLNKDSISEEDRKSAIERILVQVEKHFKDYDNETDRKLFKQTMTIFYNNVEENFRPATLNESVSKHGSDFEAYSRELYDHSLLTSHEKIKELFASFELTDLEKIQNDPVYQLANEGALIYSRNIRQEIYLLEHIIDNLNGTYMKGLREMKKDEMLYPDANSTLRVAYGQVDDYYPRDGVHYLYYTTIDGVMEKYIPGDEEFDLPEKLVELYEQKDYGQYGSDGTLMVCFIASNHTTGGNSGSPVINGKGQLIGTNFDRNWEGTMSDIMYDPDQVRNISVDIRYTLFIIDKFAGAKHLIEEMTIVDSDKAKKAGSLKEMIMDQN